MNRLILSGACVIGNPAKGVGEMTDIVTEAGKIADMRPSLAGRTDDSAEAIDLTGRTIIPGLVNAHMHSWQTPMRGLAADWQLMEYLTWMHGRVMPVLTPDDVYLGTLAGAINQINCGTATLADWCHANRTPEHSDAGVAALVESGIRAVFFHGTPHGQEGQRRDEVERLLESSAFASGGLLTLGLAIAGPLYCAPEFAEADLALGRELGLIVSMHHSGPGGSSDVWIDLISKGLFGPWVNIVHANMMDDELLKRLVDLGVSFTLTPEVELNDGHGQPITGRLRALGALPSIGIDIESAVSAELITAARLAMSNQRGLDRGVAQDQSTIAPKRIHRSEAIHWITRGGAQALGLHDRTGTIAVGMEADLTIIDGRALNLAPISDPLTTVLHSSLANIEAVMIAGKWQKHAGRLLYAGQETLHGRLSDARMRILAAAELPESAFA